RPGCTGLPACRGCPPPASSFELPTFAAAAAPPWHSEPVACTAVPDCLGMSACRGGPRPATSGGPPASAGTAALPWRTRTAACTGAPDCFGTTACRGGPHPGAAAECPGQLPDAVARTCIHPDRNRCRRSLGGSPLPP